MFKSIENSAELQKYIFTYGVNEHPLQKEIREYTEKNLGNSAIMQISPDQGALLQFIIKSSNIIISADESKACIKLPKSSKAAKNIIEP